MVVRVAVVGAGSISREFALNHFGPHTSTRVTAIVDTNLVKAETLATEVGSFQAGGKVGLAGTRLYTSTVTDKLGTPIKHASTISQILEDCDLVYIGTTPASHAALVQQALSGKKHVLLEKPVAASVDDCDAIVNAVERAAPNGVVLGMNIGMRWNNALITLRKLAINDPEHKTIGKVTGGKLSLHFKQWPREWQVQPWCAKRAQGGPLREVGTHFFFGLHEIFGHESITRVKAVVTYPDGAEGSDAESAVEGVIEIQSGVQILLSVKTKETTATNDVYDLSIQGETGALNLFGFTNLEHVPSTGPRQLLVDAATYGRVDSVQSVVTAIETKSHQGLVTAKQGRNAQRVLDAIVSSDGKWTQVLYL